MNILFADDDSTSRLIAQTALRSLGHECLTVDDGGQAWDAFQSRQPDVVISDWMMPGLTGLDLCRNIRAHDTPGNYTYFIMVTHHGELEQVVEGMIAGADDYLVKPLDSEDLQVRLIAAARVTSLHRQLADQRAELERLNHRLAETNQDLRDIDRLTDEFGRARLTPVAPRASKRF
jgi:two-component system cell cycle response regulator